VVVDGWKSRALSAAFLFRTRAAACGDLCLAFGQNQTCAAQKLMSALGHKQTYAVHNGMSKAH